MTIIQHHTSAALSSLVTWLKIDITFPKNAMIGFDGYVDAIYRVIENYSSMGEPQYYRTIGAYGQRIINAAGKSADIGIELMERRMGGNAPLMADGMAALDDHVTLIGQLGYPEPDPCFSRLHSKISAYSFSDPCQTIALEFSDGKIMMGDLKNSVSHNCETIERIIGLPALQEQIQKADLISVLNWSAHPGVSEIACRISELATVRKRTMFFDLSDPNGLTREQLLDRLSCIARIGKTHPTVLGMNENEARTVFPCLYPEIPEEMETTEMAERYGQQVMEHLELTAMMIHAVSYAIGFDGQHICYADGFLVENPVTTTGAGDHYNAGFCHGLMYGLPIEQCLLLGCAASSFYVRTGRSPSRREVAQYLESREEMS